MEPQFAKLVRIDKKRHLQLRLSRTLRPKATLCEILNLLQLDYQIFRSVCHQPDCPHCPNLLHAARDLEVSAGRERLKRQIKEDEKLREHLREWQAQIPEIKSATPEQVKRIGQSLIQPPFLAFKLQKLDWIHKRFEKQKSDMVDGCPVCYEPYNRCFISFQCSHLLCWDCLVKLVQAQYNRKNTHVRCPLCNLPVLGKASEALDTVAPLAPAETEEEEEVLTEPETQPYSPEPEFSLPSLEPPNDLAQLYLDFYTIGGRYSTIVFSGFENYERLDKFKTIMRHPLFNNTFNLKNPTENPLTQLENLQKECFERCRTKLLYDTPFDLLPLKDFNDFFIPFLDATIDHGDIVVAFLNFRNRLQSFIPISSQ